jgi:hypothetical protein
MQVLRASAAAVVLTGLLGGFPGSYRADKSVVIQGSVLRLALGKPQSMLDVQVLDKKGRPVVWVVEWNTGTGSALIRPDTLKPGDKVTVTGNPARDAASHHLRMRAIVRPADGWRWNDLLDYD